MTDTTVSRKGYALFPVLIVGFLLPYRLNGQPSQPMSPQDRLRISGKPALSPQQQASIPPSVSSVTQPPVSGPPPGTTGEQVPAAGPGYLYMPGAPYQPPTPPKVVGKGYIRYSYKGEAVGGEVPDDGGVVTTAQGRIYTIVRGDCLWNIAGTFYSDPWRWREIWERNPYIVNPDLIYPGKPLELGLAGVGPSSDMVPPPQPLDSSYLTQRFSFSDATAGFLDDTATVDADSVVLAQREAEDLRLLNSIIKRKILTAEFLAKSPFLWSEKDVRGLIYPGDGRIDPRTTKEAFQQYEEMPIVLLGKNTYAVGDTLDIYRSERMVSFKKRKANLVRRVGRAYVIETKNKWLKAVLCECWDAVKPGDRVGRAQPFPRMAVIEYVRPTQALSAEVFERVEQTLFPYPFNTFIIDRGTTDGVRVGDLFVAYRVGKEASPAPAQLACAVHVGGDYATLATVMLYQNSLKSGDRVELVRRIQTQ